MAINIHNLRVSNMTVGPLSGGGNGGGGSSSGWRTSEPTYLVVGGTGYDSNNGRSYQYDLATLTRTYIDTGRGGNSGATFGNNYYVGSTTNDQVTVYDATAGAMPNTRQATISKPSDTDTFGQSIAASSDYLVIGAPGDDTLHGNSGAVFIYDPSNLSSTPTKIIPYGTFNSTDRLEFGTSVALNGNTLAVGAPSNSNTSYNGSVMVYDIANSSANPTVLEVTSFDGEGKDLFGQSVAITTDYVIVGSPNSDQNGYLSGAVYLYSRSNLAASPTILTPGLNDNAGYAVAATDEYLVVGASSEDTTLRDSGAIFVYDMNDLLASPTMVKASDPQEYARLGKSVDVQGSTIVVGADEYDDDFSGDENTGAVYIFDANNLSTPGTKLVDSLGKTRHGRFGYSVSLG